MSADVTISGSPGALEERPVGRSIGRGAKLRCPRCGKGKIFDGYLKVHPVCAVCGEELHHQRADDAPPYIVISVVAHIVIGGLLSVETTYHPPAWVQMAIWLPATVILSLAMLPSVKGALIGLQWALRMHGFGGEGEDGALRDGGLKPDSPV
ncbi:DUF983 domain-containing protein [Hansschlegelia quercus]|uniref:DUF983 domain-containing protein n=1 Tax=Hansschlegelia quercus TaxID=2528245 RepID=A0A4Q9GJT1_9HYPH|nr:DUF983 domain-containing protein [Hansschlegelia quercus]TBN54388.1 DUF983 domain-containing protein [Hansschlegelia quercus]